MSEILNPLSWQVFKVAVPALAKDSHGSTLPDQETELRLKFSLSSGLGAGQIKLILLAELSVNASLRESITAFVSVERTKEFKKTFDPMRPNRR